MVNLMRTSGLVQTKIKKKPRYIRIQFKCILVSNNLATIEIVLKYYWNNRYVRKGNLLSFKVTVCIISASSDNSAFNTKAKMQSIFFVGRRCYIVAVCLYPPSSFNPLSSLRFSRAAACLASAVFLLPALQGEEGAKEVRVGPGKGRGLTLKRHWIRPKWIVDVLCNSTHIELFTVDLSYFELHWCGPPYWLKAASIYLNNKCGD